LKGAEPPFLGPVASPLFFFFFFNLEIYQIALKFYLKSVPTTQRITLSLIKILFSKPGRILEIFQTNTVYILKQLHFKKKFIEIPNLPFPELSWNAQLENDPKHSVGLHYDSRFNGTETRGLENSAFQIYSVTNAVFTQF